MSTSLSDLVEAGVSFNINFLNEGNIFMQNNSRNIGNMTGNSFGDNVNFQGDDVTQTKVINNEINNAIDELKREINTLLSSEYEKEDANLEVEKLIKAIDKKDKNRAIEVFGKLPEIIRTSAAGFTLYHHLTSLFT